MKLKVLAMLVVASIVLPAAAQDLVLGLSYPKTGRYSTISATEVAVDIAVAEINAAGGVNGRKIRLDKFDTASDAKNAQIAVQRFAEDVKALAIIGPYSSQEAQVAFATSERLEIVQIPNSATAPGLIGDLAGIGDVAQDLVDSQPVQGVAEDASQAD